MTIACRPCSPIWLPYVPRSTRQQLQAQFKQTLQQAMGDANRAVFQTGAVSFKRSKDSSGVDLAHLLADHPEFETQYAISEAGFPAFSRFHLIPIPMTNLECLTEIMTFSRYGARASVRDGCAQPARGARCDNMPDQLQVNPMISARAWQGVAQEIRTKLEAHFSDSPHCSQFFPHFLF
jgi:hypothetical protein